MSRVDETKAYKELDRLIHKMLEINKDDPIEIIFALNMMAAELALATIEVLESGG